jgi:regulatory LuxR family protein
VTAPASPATPDAPATVRLAEVLAALSLATDAGNGFPLEKSLRNAVIAVRLGERIGLEPRALSDVYYVALLRSIGCTAYAHETAAWLGGDDVAFHVLNERFDPGRPAALVRDVVVGMGAWAPPAIRARSVARFLTLGPRKGREATASACEVSVSLARRLGLSPGVAEGLDQVYERWDGRGGSGTSTRASPTLLARGLTNKEIAHRLVVSPRTVQHHVAHIYAKIGRRTRAGTAMFAMEHGLAADPAAPA